MGPKAGISPIAGAHRETVVRAFAGAVAADPSQPLLTWYDDTTGERVELSGATLDNWVAKTANLLVDGCGLGPGGRAAVLLPPHWQTAAVLLGCWSAGLSVAGGPEPADVEFAAATAPPAMPASTPAVAPAVGPAVGTGAADRFALGLAPLGAPLRTVPAGYADYIVEVRGHGDRFTPYQPVGPGDAARHGTAAIDHGGLHAASAARASTLGLTAGARVLVDAATRPDPLDWLLAPLVAGATVVLCAGLDRAGVPRRMAAERVTVDLTATPG